MFKLLIAVVNAVAVVNADPITEDELAAVKLLQNSGISKGDAEACIKSCPRAKREKAVSHSLTRDELVKAFCDDVYCIKQNCDVGAYPSLAKGTTLVAAVAECAKAGYNVVNTADELAAGMLLEKGDTSKRDVDTCIEACPRGKRDKALSHALTRLEVVKAFCDDVYCIKQNCVDGVYAALSVGHTLEAAEADCLAEGYTKSSSTSSTRSTSSSSSSSSSSNAPAPAAAEGRQDQQQPQRLQQNEGERRLRRALTVAAIVAIAVSAVATIAAIAVFVAFATFARH